MTWSGGSYTRPGGSTAWGDDRDANVEIEAGLHDVHDEDLAQGINACLHKGGQNSATANLDMGSNKLVNMADPTNAQDAATKNYVDSMSVVPTACVLPYAGSSAPTGFLVCDGAAVSRATYATLFAVIGTTYGSGDGSTTFNLPDCGGRVVAGKESSATRLTLSGSGIDGGLLGDSGGAETHQLIEAELPAHDHKKYSGNLYGLTGLTAAPGGAYSTVGGGNNYNSHRTGSTGSDTAHQNTQPTLVLNYIIKT